MAKRPPWELAAAVDAKNAFSRTKYECLENLTPENENDIQSTLDAGAEVVPRDFAERLS